jgi:hypothetical protein
MPSHMVARRSSLIVSHQVPTKPKRPPPIVNTNTTTPNTTAPKVAAPRVDKKFIICDY